MSVGINANTARYEAVTVFDCPMLFSCAYVDPATVPDGIYQYAVRHHSENIDQPTQICEWAVVNRYGTLLSASAVKMEKIPGTYMTARNVDPVADWNREGYETTLDEYLQENPLLKGVVV